MHKKASEEMGLSKKPTVPTGDRGPAGLHGGRGQGSGERRTDARLLTGFI